MENLISANSKLFFWSYVKDLKKSGELPSDMYFKNRKSMYNIDITGLLEDKISEVLCTAPSHSASSRRIRLNYCTGRFL